MRTGALTAVLITSLAAGFYGCVGDDPQLEGPNARADAAPPNDGGLPGDGNGNGDGAPAASCDLAAPFGTPLLVPGLESAGGDSTPSLTPDELEIYFTRIPPSQDFNGAGIFRARRASLRAAFGTPTRFFDRPGLFDSDPLVSADGTTVLAALLGANGGAGGADIFAITADGGASAVVGVNTPQNDGQPFLSVDGSELWFVRSVTEALADGGSRSQTDIFHAAYAAGVASAVGPVAELDLASSNESWPVLSADRKTIFYASSRTDAVPSTSGENVWMARRGAATGPFDPPTPVPELNSARSDAPRWVSADGCRLYLGSDRGGDTKIYMAERPQ